MTSWRTLAFGEQITYVPGSDTLLSIGNYTQYVTDPAGDTVFVRLPFEDGGLYTDVLDQNSASFYVGMFRVTDNEGLPDLPIGSWVAAPLIDQADDRTDDRILLDFSANYDATIDQLAGAGVTVVADGLGVLFEVAHAPFVIEDLNAPTPPPSPEPATEPPIDVRVSKFVPAGFNSAEIIAGLHTAMSFGMPNRVEDRATFYLPRTSVETPVPMDLHSVPFNPTVRRAVSTDRVQVNCAVEFYAGGQVIEHFGAVAADKILLTLLDAEYQQVKNFAYVVAGGDKYLRSITQPPMALGSIDVWQVWADAENER